MAMPSTSDDVCNPFGLLAPPLWIAFGQPLLGLPTNFSECLAFLFNSHNNSFELFWLWQNNFRYSAQCPFCCIAYALPQNFHCSTAFAVL
jgi:hypothetical protein